VDITELSEYLLDKLNCFFVTPVQSMNNYMHVLSRDNHRQRWLLRVPLHHSTSLPIYILLRSIPQYPKRFYLYIYYSEVFLTTQRGSTYTHTTPKYSSLPGAVLEHSLTRLYKQTPYHFYDINYSRGGQFVGTGIYSVVITV
jgi:hypothetical protein